MTISTGAIRASSNLVAGTIFFEFFCYIFILIGSSYNFVVLFAAKKAKLKLAVSWASVPVWAWMCCTRDLVQVTRHLQATGNL
jgi:hypothetical protein